MKTLHVLTGLALIVLIFGCTDDQKSPTSNLRYVAPIATPTTPTFFEFDCLSDCSGHEAGWDWANERGIEFEYQCGGKSQSFIEGCIAYARYKDEFDSWLEFEESDYVRR
jgi:hypothetical protein